MHTNMTATDHIREIKIWAREAIMDNSELAGFEGEVLWDSADAYISAYVPDAPLALEIRTRLFGADAL